MVPHRAPDTGTLTAPQTVRTPRLGRYLPVGLALALFAQWPLRDGLHAYSPLANDVGQIFFAWYSALAISAATRSHSHLVVRLVGTNRSQSVPLWRSLGLFLCIAPWALFLLWTTLPHAWFSTLQQEHFAEALTPGYFLIRIAELTLCSLALWDAARMLYRGWRYQAPAVTP